MFSFINIDFPTLQLPITRVYSIHSNHARYEHETLTARIIDWEISYDSISASTPVTLTINGIGTTRTINGYVHHIIPDISPEKHYVDIVIIGASYIFKQESQKVWTNATADQVIAEIADANNFSYVAIPHPRVYDQISQAGMTDWELMTRLAKQSGYSLKADNTTVYFQPLTQEFTDMRQEAAYFLMNGLDKTATGIYSFKPLIGETLPYEDAKKTTVAVSGVDRSSAVDHSHINLKPVTKTRVKSVSPVFDSYHTDVVAPTYSIAKHESTSADERNRYAYRGEAVIQGNPVILPDAPVFLDGIGGLYSGYWTVLSVSHEIIGNAEYSTTITVGADSLGLSGQWTDNQKISSPSQSVKRVIKPGIRQKTIIPKTSLKKVGTSSKESLKTPLSKAKNISKLTKPTAPSYQWHGSGGNLKAPNTIEKKMPAQVLAKRLG